MCIRKCFISLLIIVKIFSTASDEFSEQPQIHANDGKLIFRAAPYRNITLRVKGEGGIFLNSVNILNKVKKKRTQLGPIQNEDVLTAERLRALLATFKSDLQSLGVRYAVLQNRTRGRGLSIDIRRTSGRLQRVQTRITQIENIILRNECEDRSDNGTKCKNGGTCYDGYNNFHCECPNGWSGKTCEEDVDECYLFAGTDLGCQNNGDCINTLGSFSCSCRNGFYGSHCRIRKAVCEESGNEELCGHGTCVYANNDAGYSCICDQGWTKNKVVPEAACNIDINECEEATNPCHSECINLPGSFKCAPCPIGYTGNGLFCSDINECSTDNGGCSIRPKVSCINTEGSYHCGECPVGWKGDGKICENTAPESCDSKNICFTGAKCEYISNTVVCTCPPGMYGHGFGSAGCSLQLLTDPCTNHSCQNNATCEVVGSGTRCFCEPGFMGPTCDKPDACQSSPCQNGGTCALLLNNKYRCSCPRGTTGPNCEIVRSFCGSIIQQSTGMLSYPPNGGEYLSNERCAWIIRTNISQILNVTFSRFDVEPATDCNKDWLQLHDGRSLASRLIGRFCGNSLPLGGNIKTSQRALFFWFRSDNETTAAGFNLTWNSIDYICGGVINVKEESGIIRSPGYPGNTPPNRECEWKLSAPYGYRFLLRFFEINLGSTRDNNCTRDKVLIYDSDLLLRSICEPALIEPLHSSSNVIQLQFHTDALGTDSSFQLHYEVVPTAPNCGGIFTEPAGVIAGYINGRICSYLIQQPIGTKIQLDFTNINLVKSEGCYIQKIEIFDGNTDEANLLKSLCGNQEGIEPLTSSGNMMLIRYEYLLPSFSLPKSFEVQYKRVCNEEFTFADGGFLTTPNYPKSYYEHMECSFIIRGPVNTVVHINFTDFSISKDNAHQELNDTSLSLLSNTTTFSADETFVDVYLSNNNKRRYYEGTFLHLVSEKNVLRIVFHGGSNQQKGRGIRIEYYFEKINCGGILTEDSGRIQHLSMAHPAAQDCEWVIEVPQGKHIQLNVHFQHWNIFKCDAGDTDVEIYANDTSTEGQLLMSFCQQSKTFNESFLAKTITVILHMSRKIRSLVNLVVDFKSIDNSAACGGNFTARYGVLKTPSWPSNYDDSMDCTWVISAPLGHKIELVVQNFSVETTSEICNDDYLEIRNGKSSTSPLIGKFCGSTIPARLPSFTNYLYLHFVSDSYISDKGFFITWQQTETGCGGKLNSYTGSIHSPHNSDVNAGTVSCDWLITVARGSTITAHVTVVEDDSDLCSQNLLAVYDGRTVNSPQLKFNCTNIGSAVQLTTTSNQALIIYNFDKSDVENGLQFFIDYETNCNAKLDNLQGVIESPNFPDNYPPNLNCFWDVHGGQNNKFQLIFSHLNVEMRDESCDFDFVDVIDLRNEDILSKQHLCSTPHRSITTEGNRFQVKFVTDYSEHAIGFRLEYKRIGCGDKLSANYGSIQSPNAPYSIDMNCDWYIEVQAGRKIILNFHEIHIETERGDCIEDGIIVSDEKNSTTNLLKECRIDQVPVTITSPANRLYIHFFTSNTRSRKYISATYNTRDASCGGTFRGNSGQIKYPTNSDVSGINTECVWQIVVDNSYGINLVFDTFNISCSGTFLSVWKPLDSRDQLIQKTCGSILPESRWIQSNRLKVVYKASADGWGIFSFKFKRACGGYLNDTSGYIKARWDENCEWKIESENSKIFLNILHLECDCSKQTNCTNGLKLIDGNDESKLNEFCDNHQSNIVLSTSALYIYATKIEFNAKYSIVQSSCGGTLTSIRGILTSPYYPQSYPSNVECVWEIKASSGNYLELDINEMDIVESENCNQDFLEIRQKNELGNIVKLYCSNETVAEKLIIFERAWIKFRSSEGNTARGFKLQWNYAHNNELNSSVGSIEAPPLSSIRNQEPYSWRILMPRGRFISIDFKEYNRGLRLYDGFDDSALEIPIPISPWQYTSSSNVLYLVSNNEALEAFKIDWKNVNNTVTQSNLTTNECNQTYILSYMNRLNISSPGYPKDYANDLNCEWVIKPEDPTEHVVLSIYDVKLEQYAQSDYLRVFSSSNLRSWHQELNIFDSRNKSSLKPIEVVHGTPYLKVVFHSDYSFSNTGFTSIARTACGSNMTALTGQILNRRELRSWSSNALCTWHIEAQVGKRIVLNFSFGNRVVSKTQACRQYAVVYDGFDDNAPILPPGRICNQDGRNVKNLGSSTNRLTIKYNLNWTNIFEMDLDFNLTYQQVGGCEMEIQLSHYLPSVNISSPNYPNVPNPHTECNWLIVGPIGETLQAEFISRFSLNTRYCDKEFVEFFDGSTELSRSFGRFCTKPQPIRSTGNILRLHYLTDINEPRNGFLLNVSIANCGGIYTNIQGEISSKDYPAPGAYPKPDICEYTIKMPHPSRIRLNFNDLDLPFNANNLNRSDRIEIVTLSENPETIAVLYGNATLMPILETDYNVITLRFITFPGSHLHRGFRLKFQRLYGGCYRDVDNESGVLTYKTLERSRLYTSCRWKIRVPKGQRVSFQFEEFEMQSVANNTERTPAYPFVRTKISFFNDLELLSKITEIDANNVNMSEKIVSSDNLMYVRIDNNGYLAPIRKIQARYSSTEESPCPKDINEQFAGIVDTTNLEPNTNFFCNTKFSLNGFETITFIIRELQITRNNNNGNYAIRFNDERMLIPYKTVIANVSDTMVSLSSRGGMLSILQNDAVKIKRFSASFYRHSCGGSFDISDDFNIVFPPDDFEYNGDGKPVECSWLITGASESRPYKLIGNVSLSNDCNKEYISVHSLMSSDQPLIAKICHNSTEITAGIDLKKHIINILYHSSDYKASSSSIQLKTEASIACGMRTMVRSNSPTISVNSKSYRNNVECSWEFEAGFGLYMFLEFTGRFFIEKSENCTKDYLEVFTYDDEIWQPKERFCGREVPSKFNATSNRMLIVFRTDNSTTGDGFSFSVSASCLATFNVTDQVQIVHTPDLRSLPYSRFQCSYTFLSNSTNAINLQIRERFPSYARRPHSPPWSCSLGSFTAYKKDTDGNEIKAGEYCEPTVITENHYLRLTSNIFYDFFLISYQLNTCGGNISSFTIIRPLAAPKEEGDLYAHNMNCVWNVRAPTDYSILVRFKYFEMEAHDKCQLDFVAINAGPAPRADNEIIKLCGNLSGDPPLVLVDANRAVITAVSDSSLAEKGFMAEVIFVRNCNERIALTNDDTISQPLIMIRNYTIESYEELHCQIRVTAPESYRVKIQMRNLYINPVECVDKRCEQCNYLEIIEAAQTMDTSISMGKFCTKDGTKRTLVTSDEHALLQFSFIKAGNYTLELVLEMEKPVCGGPSELDLRREKELTIQFPPNNESTYPANAHCLWRIKSATDFQIHFEYLVLQTPSAETGKCVDYLRVAQYTTYLQEEENYCGNATGFTKYITATTRNESDFTELTFHSDDSVEDKGFKISISSQQSCNRTYTKLSGNIDFNGSGERNQTCVQNIVLPDSFSINLYVLIFNTHSAESNCSKPNFQVTDTSVNKTLRTRCISYYYDEHLQTNSSAIRINTRNFDQLNIFYFASKKSSGVGCGGEIHTMSGDISSPSYEHRNFSECRWDISVPEPSRLELYFRTFDMGSKVNCDLDYVNIIEISTDGEEKVAKSICANQYMNRFLPKTSRIAVVSKKSPNFDGNGWMLNFRKIVN
ncbi:cubilin homolog [Bactrocera neohumeralis]|uniref:cubilin homolog n=1 Tax=Bactrocera neohumeralis TaxID=98809 RepID=UPI0021659575|nr:cubilin homolog [Bactrocera neohumeralis]